MKSIEPRLKELKSSLYLLNKNILARISLIVVALLVLLAIFAPIIIPYPDHATHEVNPVDKLLPPSG